MQKACLDAHGALGAALSVWHEYLDKPRAVNQIDSMQRAYLGQQSYDTDSRTYLDSINAPYEYLADDELFPRLAQILGDENVVGWFHGRMEFGLRALGGVLFLAIHVVRKCSR